MKKFAIGLISIVLLLSAIGLFLPSETHIQHRRVMPADFMTVHGQVNNLKSWQNWCPWMENASGLKLSFSDTTEGLGATCTWENKKFGPMEARIYDTKPFASVGAKVNFKWLGEAVCTFENGGYESQGFTWTLDLYYGWNVLKRWVGFFSKETLDQDVERGLSNLESYIQANPDLKTIESKKYQGGHTPEKTLEIIETTFTGRQFLSIRSNSVPENDIPKTIAQDLSQITVFTASATPDNLRVPFVIYQHFNSVKSTVDIEVCYEVNKDIKGSKQVRFNKWDDRKAVMAKHVYVEYVFLMEEIIQ